MTARKFFQSIIENANDIIIITQVSDTGRAGPRIIYVNPAFTALTGYTPDEVIGNSPSMLQGEDTDPEVKRGIREALMRHEPIRATLLNYSKTGTQYWIELNLIPLQDGAGKVTHYAAIERDITEQKKLEQSLLELSMTDPLTGIANRRAFFDKLSYEFDRSRRYIHQLSAISLDLDHFKNVNDQFGHAAGDDVLRALAQICGAQLRTVDVPARIGGEEFAILLPETAAAAAADVAERIRAALAQAPIPSGGESIAITASFGVTELRRDDAKPEDALTRADKALYDAKHAGRNRVVTA